MKQVLIGFKLADFSGFWEGMHGFCSMGVCKFATPYQNGRHFPSTMPYFPPKPCQPALPPCP